MLTFIFFMLYTIIISAKFVKNNFVLINVIWIIYWKMFDSAYLHTFALIASTRFGTQVCMPIVCHDVNGKLINTRKIRTKNLESVTM